QAILCVLARCSMPLLLISVLGAALVLNATGAISNRVQTAGTFSSQTNAPVEREYEQLLVDDEAAQAEVERWRQENKELPAKGIGIAQAELDRRIREHYKPIAKAYVEFLRRYPNHIRA